MIKITLQKISIFCQGYTGMLEYFITHLLLSGPQITNLLTSLVWKVFQIETFSPLIIGQCIKFFEGKWKCLNLEMKYGIVPEKENLETLKTFSTVFEIFVKRTFLSWGYQIFNPAIKKIIKRTLF